MEEKKLDINSIIGFVLIFGILIFMFYQNQPTPEELEAQKAEQEKIEAAAAQEEQKPQQQDAAAPIRPTETLDANDSIAAVQYKNAVGAFGNTSITEGETVLENEVLYLKISNRGGQVVEAKMKNFVTYDSIPVYLV